MDLVFYSYIEKIVNTFRERNTYSPACLDAVEHAIGVFTHCINAEEFVRSAMESAQVKELAYSVRSLNSSRSLNSGASALKRLVEHHPEAVEAGMKVLDAIPNNSESIQRIEKKVGHLPNPKDHIYGRNTFNLLATHSVDDIKSAIHLMEQVSEELSSR